MGTIKAVGVIGAGQMGAGIAQVAALSGFDAYLWDVKQEVVAKATESIKGHLTKMVEKGKISSDAAREATARLRPIATLKEMVNSHLVIEAATENTELKLKIFGELDSLMPPSTYLTSNTSSISITKIAGVTKRPDKVMGVHFMNPPPLMKLVELIRGIQTSDETFSTIKACVESMGKTTALAKDSPGFIVNRILGPMINEAVYLLHEGNTREDIDTGMLLGTNQPMGPLALADLIGLDTCLAILRVLHSELGEDKYRPCPLLVKYVEAGWLGRKTKRGFYEYP